MPQNPQEGYLTDEAGRKKGAPPERIPGKPEVSREINKRRCLYMSSKSYVAFTYDPHEYVKNLVREYKSINNFLKSNEYKVFRGLVKVGILSQMGQFKDEYVALIEKTLDYIFRKAEGKDAPKIEFPPFWRTAFYIYTHYYETSILGKEAYFKKRNSAFLPPEESYFHSSTFSPRWGPQSVKFNIHEEIDKRIEGNYDPEILLSHFIEVINKEDEDPFNPSRTVLFHRHDSDKEDKIKALLKGEVFSSSEIKLGKELWLSIFKTYVYGTELFLWEELTEGIVDRFFQEVIAHSGASEKDKEIVEKSNLSRILAAQMLYSSYASFHDNSYLPSNDTKNVFFPAFSYLFKPINFELPIIAKAHAINYEALLNLTYNFLNDHLGLYVMPNFSRLPLNSINELTFRTAIASLKTAYTFLFQNTPAEELLKEYKTTLEVLKKVPAFGAFFDSENKDVIEGYPAQDLEQSKLLTSLEAFLKTTDPDENTGDSSTWFGRVKGDRKTLGSLVMAETGAYFKAVENIAKFYEGECDFEKDFVEEAKKFFEEKIPKTEPITIDSAQLLKEVSQTPTDFELFNNILSSFESKLTENFPGTPDKNETEQENTEADKQTSRPINSLHELKKALEDYALFIIDTPFEGRKNKREELERRIHKGKYQTVLKDLKKIFNLSNYERDIVYLLTAVSYSGKVVAKISKFVDNKFPEIRIFRPFHVEFGSLSLTVLLEIVGKSELNQEIEHKIYLSMLPKGKLVKYRIITLREGIFDSLLRDMSSLLHQTVSLDPVFFQQALGFPIKYSDLTSSESLNLYKPSVSLEDVVLPEEIIETVVKAANVYKNSRKYIKKNRRFLSPGLVMYFEGPSGVGKTLLANAIANHLNMNILLATLNRGHSFSYREEGAYIKQLFKEALLNNAILFFDEWAYPHDAWRSPESTMGVLRQMLDIYPGIVIFASNESPPTSDEPFLRRIHYHIVFPRPSKKERKKIWQIHFEKLKEELPIEVNIDVDLDIIAEAYEISGGNIRNIVSRIGRIITEEFTLNTDRKAYTITTQDVLEIAKEMLGSGIYNPITRKEDRLTLDSLILPEDVFRDIKGILRLITSGVTMKDIGLPVPYYGTKAGLKLLFYGAPGTGKTLTAKALANESGKSLKILDISSILSFLVGGTSRNIKEFFRTTNPNTHIILIDDGEGLLARRTKVTYSTDRYANIDTVVMMKEIEEFPGVVIVTSNFIGEIDDAVLRRFYKAIEFPAPTPELREKIWEKHMPSGVEIADDVNIKFLAEKYELTGARIANAVLIAVREALIEGRKVVTMEDFERAAAYMYKVSTENERKAFKRLKKIGF